MRQATDKRDATLNKSDSMRRLSFKEKVAYGLGGGAEIIMANSILILAMPVYYLGLGVRAEILGVILLGTKKTFDAVTDTFRGICPTTCGFAGDDENPLFCWVD